MERLLRRRRHLCSVPATAYTCSRQYFSIYYRYISVEESRCFRPGHRHCAWVGGRQRHLSPISHLSMGERSLVLGLMTRWKVLVLDRGYDKAWSVLQKLRVLAKLPPDEEPTLPDEFHTKANGSLVHQRTLWNSSSILNPFQQSVSGPFFLGDPLLVWRDDLYGMDRRGSEAGPEQQNILLSRPNSFQSVLSCRA